MTDPYARLPELYDLEHGGYREDSDLYLQLSEVIGDPILELGCGTGRVLLPLAVAGHRVTGLDHSRAMLDRARASLVDAGVDQQVTLHQASMTAADLAPGGPFGLVIVSLNGLMHLSSPSQQRQALVAARRALDPRGMLVIDLQNPSPEWLRPFDGRVLHEGAWTRPDGTSIDRFAARTHAYSVQRIDTDLWYDLVDEAGAFSRVRTHFPMRYVTRPELELLLELAGFAEWQIYGSYELEPHDDASERLIVMAEVTSSKG